MGYYIRGQHELLLIARKGELPPPDEASRVSSVLNLAVAKEENLDKWPLLLPRGEHSAKPLGISRLHRATLNFYSSWSSTVVFQKKCDTDVTFLWLSFVSQSSCFLLLLNQFPQRHFYIAERTTNVTKRQMIRHIILTLAGQAILQ